MLSLIAAAWLVAVCGWALHERSGTRYGRALGNTSLIIALSTLTYTSLYGHGHHHHHPPPNRPVSQVAQVIQPTPDAAYVGSSLGDSYHLPQCFYVRQTKHLIHFLSREDAENRGRVPCDNCLPYEDQKHVSH